MTTDMDDDLASALGRVALADAESDEWLVIVMAAILPSLTVEIIRVLVASDSSVQKIDKIRSLVKQRGYEHSGVGDSHEPVETLAARSKQLKQRRDLALHSFYASPDGEQLKRFRSRKPDTPATSVLALNELANEIHAASQQWAAVARQLEHQAAEMANQMAEASMLLEDCRELLPVLRLSSGQLSALRDNPEGHARLAIKGHGRWRSLPDHETPDEDECVATLGPNGRIEIVLNDGRTLAGGDTGWRDVTDLAAARDPDVQLSMIRRIHGSVQYAQRGGQPLPGERNLLADSLQQRVFHQGSLNIADVLPPFIRDLDGFSPPARS